MQQEIIIFEGIQCVVRFPRGYECGKKYPVIVFLHGAGWRGNDTNLLLQNPYFTITEKYEDFPFITVAPHCSENTWFDIFERLKRLVVQVSRECYADSSRLYLMGPSMGGYATWQLAMSMPEYFAAIIPICGGGMYWNTGRLSNVPIWAFHGAKDMCVLLEESQKMIEGVNRNGGNAKLTIYPNNDHDAWSDTYSNKKVFEWLLEHDKIGG